VRLSFREILVPLLVGLGLLAGLCREVVLASLYGISQDLETFRVAFGLPSILSESLAVSFVSVLLPWFISERSNTAPKKGEALQAAFLVSISIFFLGVITMPWQAHIFAPGFDAPQTKSLIIAGQICWGMFLFMTLSLPLRANLSAENTLWPAAASALLRSIFFIASALSLGILIKEQTDVTLPIAALFAGIGVYFIHLFAMPSSARKKTLSFYASNTDKATVWLITKSLYVVILTQIILSGGRIIDRAVISQFEQGYLAALEYSYAITMAGAAGLATTANIILTPKLAKSLKTLNTVPKSQYQLIAMIVALSTLVGGVGAIFSSEIISIIYQNGNFGSRATAMTAEIFGIHGLALGPIVCALLLSQILILTGRQRVFLALSLLKLLIKSIIIVLVIWLNWNAKGIASTLLVAELGFCIAMAPFVLKDKQKH
jgi:peptidoglycan biosynthesis protein MviN/MurJ (putative lipid II flippase)